MRIIIFTILITIIISGCASLNDAMTPGLQVSESDFDGTKFISQPVVGANRPSLSTSDARNQLGFNWESKTPNEIYLTVGVAGDIANVQAAEFIADEIPITAGQPIDILTTFKTTKYFGTNSSNRFKITLADFKKIAAAHIVKYRITANGKEYTSRFGKEYPFVPASGKFEPFLNKLTELKP